MMKLKNTKFSSLFHLIALFIVQETSIHGQQTYIKFNHISLQHGLSQSTVYTILQDNNGFMWFGTLDGLNRFDGFNMKIFRHDPKDSTTISDNYINVLFEDSDNNLWVGTKNGGLCLLSRIKHNFIRYIHKPEDEFSISSNNVISICELKKGMLLIGTDDGLNVFDSRKGKVQNMIELSGNNNLQINCLFKDYDNNIWIGTKNGLFYKSVTDNSYIRKYEEQDVQKETVINSLFEDSNGRLWIGYNNGLSVFSKKEDLAIPFRSENINRHKLYTSNIKAINEDGNGDIWVGTEDGLFRINNASNEIQTFIHDPSNEYGLSENIIETIYKDKANALWIGTSLGGINKCDKTTKGFAIYRHSPLNKKSLNNNKVRSIYEDKSGNLWIGTVEGGLNKWDRKTDHFYHYSHDRAKPGSISHDHVRSILEDSTGTFWVGTDGGGLNKFNQKTQGFYSYTFDDNDPNSLSNNRVWKVYEDRQGNLWIGTFGGGLNMYVAKRDHFIHYKYNAEDPNSLSHDNVSTIYEDTRENLWVGTFEGGLNLFNRENNSFLYFKNNIDDTTSISDNRIYYIFEDSENSLWIGTKGGLNKYNYETHTFIRFTEKDGLPNDVILGILEDYENNLWLSTNLGLSKFDKKNMRFRNYDIRDGLQSNEFLVGSCLKSKNGDLLFGGINGFNIFSPEDIFDNPYKPDIAITGFKLFNKDVDFDTIITEKKNLNLCWRDKVISFDFVALNYIFPQKNQFAYIMEGFETEWNKVGTRRYANYTNLPPGDYTFRVIGSNNDGIWNDIGTAINIHIKPPFWKTVWFTILEVVIIIMIIVVYIKWRERKLQRDKKNLELKVKQRTAEIAKQKDQIELQRDEIQEQKKEITDSIHYACRIQSAAIPTDESISALLSDYFVLYKPRDIVSGDFYWVGMKKEKIIIVAADCTGHGVPGAFMSMLGIAFLNEIINKEDITKPNIILEQLRKNVIKSLRQKGEEGESKDGMDAAVISIDTKKLKLEYAGANNPLYLIRNKELEVLKADKMPVAIYADMKDFNIHPYDLEKGDCIYLFSDGYADQFGGPKEKKFMYKQFKQLLVDICHQPMIEQKAILDNTIEEWKGEVHQIDDILVMGIRV